MPVFEKSQPRKFTPINYEPRKMQGGKEGTSSRTSQGTDIFLQKRDHGIRYVDWASAPQKESGKRYALYEGAGFWRTMWETVCHWFRKPTPLLKEGRSQAEGKEPKGDGSRGKDKGDRNRKQGGRDSFRKQEKKGGRDPRGGAPRNQVKTAGGTGEEDSAGGSRRNRSRRRRPEGGQQGNRESGQVRGNAPKHQGKPAEQGTRHSQSRPQPADSRNRGEPGESQTGTNPQAQNQRGGDEDSQNRRRSRNRRRNRGRSGGPNSGKGEDSRKSDGAGE